MNRVIAVEENLKPVKEFLAAQGCKVTDLHALRDMHVDAVVLSGSDENIMGMQGLAINAPIISARGKTPREVWAEVQIRLYYRSKDGFIPSFDQDTFQ